MKKATKIWLIIVVILALLGSVLCISAFAMGLNYKDLSGMAEHGLFAFDSWFTGFGVTDTQKGGLQEHHIENSSTTHHEGNMVVGNSFEHLIIDMDFGSLTVKSTDSQDVYLETDDSDDEKYFELGVTEFGITVSNRNETFWMGADAPKATLYIPEGMYFEYIELDIDAGGCSIQTALDTVQIFIDVDAGAASVNDMYADWIEIDCDAGSVVYDGQAGTGGTVDVDAGSVELQIKEKAFENYDYDIDVSAGTLTINEREYSGMDYEEYISHQAEGTWMLTCDVGKINMKVNN